MSTLVSFSNSTQEEATQDAVYAMPATPFQSRLWNLNQFGPDPAWNVAVRFRLSGALDREVLEAALQLLTTRHEALRTSLQLHDGAVVQRIARRAILPVEWCDLRTLPADDQSREVLRLSTEHARQLLPLTVAPMLRARVLRLTDRENLLLWNAHHSICDGASVGVLASDLMQCYGELIAGRTPAAMSAIEYADYAVWLDAQRRTPEYEIDRRYWMQQLRASENSQLPSSWHNADSTAAAPVIHSKLLPRDLTDRLAAVAQRHGATFVHAALAAFAVPIRSYQASARVVLGVPWSGRDQAELEGVVGTFVNYLPLQFQVDGKMRYCEFLPAVRDRVTDSFEHAQFRYEDMLAELQNEGMKVSENSLFSAAFICQQDFVRPIQVAGLSLAAIPSLSPGTLRPLTVFMVERADGWRLSCEVDDHIVSSAAGLELLEQFQSVIVAVAEHPEDLLDEIAVRAGLPRFAADLDGEKTSAGNLLAASGEVKTIPATEFQRRFWQLDRLNPGGAAFHIRIRFELTGHLNVDALRTAIETVARRNEILRTTLEERNGVVWQIIHPEMPLDFRFFVSDASVAGSAGSAAQSLAEQKILAGEGETGFSLASGPLFRIRVLQIEEDRHWLAITLSHGIVDGWSGGLFLEQLQQAYERQLAGESDDKWTLPVQFSAYADTERELLSSAEKNRRQEWWRQYLQGVWLPLRLPRDISGSVELDGDSRAAQESLAIPSETAQLARRFSRQCQATLFAIFGALFQALLAHYSGQNDILFLTPLANRSDNTETIMGPLADPICIAGHIDNKTTFRELVTRFSERSMDAMENALPLTLLTPMVDMRVADGYHPLNQITFLYQRAFVHDMHWKGLEVKSLPDIPAVAGSEWQLGVIDRNENIFLELLYDATLYSERTIQTVQQHFVRLLDRAISQPDTAMSQLPILTPEETYRATRNETALPVIQRLLPRAAAAPETAPSVPKVSEEARLVARPMSQAEIDLVRIWKRLFKIDEVDVQSNFFDLGGQSLLLARLQIVLKKEFNVSLTAADVFRQPTVAELAVWLERTRSAAELAPKEQYIHATDRNPRIVPIQPQGAGRPIFVISQSMIFRTLAAELGSDQPVYAVQMLEEDMAAMESASYEQLTDFYVKLIREVQPEGPYRLAGWCVSAWIAYGVARYLEEHGAEVELLTLIDAWAPGYWSGQARMRRKLMIAVYEFQRSRAIGRRLRRNWRAQSSSDRQGPDGLIDVVKKLASRFQRRRVPAQVQQTDEMRRDEQLRIIAEQAGFAGPLRGRTLLFRSEQEPSGPLLATDMGWSRLLGRPTRVEVLPGDHHEIFNLPGARMMAVRVHAMLDISPLPPGVSGVPGNDANSERKTQNSSLVEA